MLTQDGQQRLLLWHLPDDGADPPPQPLAAPGTTVQAAFGPEERWLVTLTAEGAAHLWDLRRQPVTEPVQTLPRQERIIEAQFCSDGRWLATREESRRQIRVWALPAGEGLPSAPYVLPPNAAEDAPTISALAFDRAGRWLATGREDGSLALWNLDALDRETAPRPVKLAGARGMVTAVNFTPDGERLLASIRHPDGHDSDYLWPLALSRLAEQACARLDGGSFTQAEWETYFPTRPYRETCPVE